MSEIFKKIDTPKLYWFEIDVIKAVSILAVVLIHSITIGIEKNHVVGKFLDDWARFAVPGLFFAAGFLFKKEGIDWWSLSVKLLRRIIPPYLFCSFIILLFDLPGQPPNMEKLSISGIVFNFVFGNVIEIYYFIFVILYLYALSLLIRQFTVKLVWIMWICMIGLTVLFFLRLSFFFPPFPDYFFFIYMRHPCVSLLPYLSGWLCGIYYMEIKIYVKQHFKFFFSAVMSMDLVVLFVLHFLDTFPARQLTIQVHIYLFICFMLLSGIGKVRAKNVIAYLSKNAYGIYLIHFPIVNYVQSLYLKSPGAFSFLSMIVSWGAGLVGSIIFIEITRKLAGRYSYYLVGS